MSNYYLRQILVLGGLLVTVGCEPDLSPVWLPDSNGFVFVKSDGTIARYDLKKKGSRTLSSERLPSLPGITTNPEGSLLAIVTARASKKGQNVVIKIVRLKDGATVTSEQVEWGTDDGSHKATQSCVFWSPSGSRLLISFVIPGTLLASHVTYELKSKQFRQLTSPGPATHLANAVGISPILPDDSGYLATNTRGDGYLLVLWDGWEYSLEMDGELQKLNQALSPKTTKLSAEERDHLSTTIFTPIPSGRWNNNVIEIPTRKGVFAFDMKQKKISLKPLAPALKATFDALERKTISDPEWYLWQVSTFKTGRLAVHCKMKKNASQFRYELVDSKTGGRKVLLTTDPGSNKMTFRPLTQSSDGKHVLFSITQDRSSEIHVLRDDGVVVDRINTGTR